MATVEVLKVKYPGADAWQMGDSPELASELADLIKKGIKTASCGSFASYQQEKSAPRIGSYQRFFTREGHFSKDMELIAEEFEVVEVL